MSNKLGHRFPHLALLSLLSISLLALSALAGRAQPAGPLTQFADNVRQMHIVARYITVAT